MQRRKFIKNLTYGGAAGLTLGGIPMNLLAGNRGLKALAAASENENVLVFIQLHGGNDALNTLIPVSQYHNYYELRANIAIPDQGTRSYINVDQTVDENIQVGLHPDMMAFKQMYDAGKVAVVQNVGYPDMNLSHFRGRDIVFMGGDAMSDYQSGWMGRFLDNTYPGYPDAYPNDNMPDPIGVELSGTLSLAFHRENGIPIGLNLGNPEQFYQLISSVGVDPPITIPDSHAGDELRYIMEFEKKSNQYAERLRDVYNTGSNSTVEYDVPYPFPTPGSVARNPLAGQLKLIARLLKGGIKTKIFLCRIGGFDTHGEQVEEYDSTKGHHASLLFHLSTAVKSFYDDLGQLGIDNKVLAITFTEFGRRAYSNASYGTDHGTSTPVFIFGNALNAGIYGENPDLSPSGLRNGNLQYNIDYRQIYTSIVQDWFEASTDSLVKTGFDDWVDKKLPLLTATGDYPLMDQGAYSLLLYPNPVSASLSVDFRMEKRGGFTLRVLNADGRLVHQESAEGVFGRNNYSLNLSSLPEGIYYLSLEHGNVRTGSRFLKIR